MPELTRRRSTDAREECWHVYYGDVHAGTIAIRSGNPHDEDPWQWSCGFYPGSHPGEHQDGTAASLEEARAEFEAARKVFLAKRTEADIQAWRGQQDWTARKYAMRQAGEKLPSQKPSTLMKCVCGHDLFNGAKNQHRLQDLSDSAIKSGLGGNDNVCRPIKCNLGLAKVCKDRSFDSLFV
jgi:hypothetical protein